MSIAKKFYLKFVPFRTNNNGMGTLNSAVRIRLYFDCLSNIFGIFSYRWTRQVTENLIRFNFRIVNFQFRTFFEKNFTHCYCWSFAGVASVFLKCKSENCDTFIGDSVEETFDYLRLKNNLIKRNTLRVIVTSESPSAKIWFFDIRLYQ